MPVRQSESVFVVVLLWLVLSCLVRATKLVPHSKEHGMVQMGVPDDQCDNAKWNLMLDWDYTSDYEYRCQPSEELIPVTKTTPQLSCLSKEDIPQPIHQCMTTSIRYTDLPPRGGFHRPLWPVYGEYLYVPPQRWIHSLEHGAVVFLYHPCADQEEVRRLKKIARRCLRRHIITPYRKLPLDQPLALVTYGCKLTMSYINDETVVQFIKENAKNPTRAPEYQAWQDGQYSFYLIKPAEVVPGSNVKDSNLCPYN